MCEVVHSQTIELAGDQLALMENGAMIQELRKRASSMSKEQLLDFVMGFAEAGEDMRVELENHLHFLEDSVLQSIAPGDVREVMNWRKWSEQVFRIDGTKPGGKPEYSEAFFAWRHFLFPPPPAAPLDVAGLARELETWRQKARTFGAAVKSPGELVYHPYWVASAATALVPPGYPVFWGGASVGDRVVDNRAPEFGEDIPARPRYGVITSLEGDRDTEVSVDWQDGTKSLCLRCGKKSTFALKYA